MHFQAQNMLFAWLDQHNLRRLQVAACVNAVRQDPDGFACQYPCDYSQWRADVISPVRGALISAGTDGANELDQ